MKKILCICFSATYQRTINFNNIRLDKVNRSENYGLWASGKAVNSARVLSQLEKGSAITVCPLGKENKEDFIKLCEKDGLNLSYIEVPGKIRECWTLLDRTQKTTTELVVGETDFSEWTDAACNTAEVKFLKLITEKMNDVDAVLLAGSMQGKWNDDLYASIAGIACDCGKIFLADYIGKNLQNTLQSCPNIIVKINDEEFCQTFLEQREVEEYNTLDKMARDARLKELIVQKSKQLQNIIIVTRGIDSTLAANNGTFEECPVEKVDAINTTACGDSFNAGFLHEYINSGNFANALKKGTWCASRNAENMAPGTVHAI